MNVSLATSLHLNHSAVSPDSVGGGALPMQAFVPVGLLSLKASADQAGVGASIRVIEFNGLINSGAIPNDARFYDHLVDAILDGDDRLVGLMTDSDSLHHTIAISQALKRHSPETLVCLGGPAASPIGRLILEAFPSVDFVVQGEAEITFVELIRSLERGRAPSDVSGLTWRADHGVVANAERLVVEDLDKLPVPAFDAYDMASGAPLYLDVGRGCPFECTFCGTAPFWRRKYRMKSIARILAEMILVRDRYGRRRVNLSHDILSRDREWTHRFCTELLKADLGMTWTCSTRTDLVDPELLGEMARAGCVEIYYGIESGAKALQLKMKKNLDLEWARVIVRATADAGIHPITGFIAGHPAETLETLGETLDRFFELLRLGGFRAHLFTLCPYHESSLYREWAHAVAGLAECYDLPLAPSAGAVADDLRARHPAVFASTYRFATPHVPPQLVAAAEELSPQLVVLKSVWPSLLPHYDSALDWYARWVSWIEAHNAEERPGTRWPHQGDARDLLQFVSDELRRLGLAESEVADLVRYEQLKLHAGSLKPPDQAPARRCDGVGADTLVKRRCDYVAAPFRRDMRALLAGRRTDEAEPSAERWLVCTRNVDGDLKTLQVPSAGKLILDMCVAPLRVGDLFSSILAGKGQSSDAHGALDAGFLLVQQLVGEGLLEEVVP